jgi:predicted RNase H-like HicB family nuclease
MNDSVAIVEDAGPEKAVGVWFPDLPGCFSAGDDIDEALRNAEEALSLYVEFFNDEGHALPAARTVTQLKADPSVQSELQEHVVALVALRACPALAAE